MKENEKQMETNEIQVINGSMRPLQLGYIFCLVEDILNFHKSKTVIGYLIKQKLESMFLNKYRVLITKEDDIRIDPKLEFIHLKKEIINIVVIQSDSEITWYKAN